MTALRSDLRCSQVSDHLLMALRMATRRGEKAEAALRIARAASRASSAYDDQLLRAARSGFRLSA